MPRRILLLAALAMPSCSASDREDSTAQPLPPQHRYSPYSITQSTFDEVLPILAERHAAVKALGNSSSQWQARQEAVRHALKKLFAPLPAPHRAAPITVDRGTVEGDGSLLQRLLVETRPGYWATAGLWLPKDHVGSSSKIPAVLFPSGHSANSFREAAAQLVAANLCRRGFAVLGYDPIGQGERRMLSDLDGPGGSIANGTEHHSPAFEHEYLQRQVTISQTCNIPVMLHNYCHDDQYVTGK